MCPKYKSKREFPSERGIVGFSCTNASSTRSMEIPLDITTKHKVLFKQSNTRLPNMAIQNLFTNKEMDPKCGKESNGRKREVYPRELANEGNAILKIKSIPCLAKELPLTSSSWS